MTLASVARYRDCVIRRDLGLPQRELLKLRLRNPINSDVWMRTAGSDLEVYHEVVRERVYDPVISLINNCKTIIDLGANIGLATLNFCGHYPDCRVFAVEPDPSNFAILRRNLSSLSEAGRCQFVRAAVWDRKSQLVVEGPVGGADQFYAFSVRESSDCQSSSVDSMTMPDVIERSGFARVDLLKVDIEGAEVALFRGDIAWLHRVQAIAIEFHGDSRKACDFDSIMKYFGFSIDDSNRHTIVAVRRHDDEGAGCQRSAGLE